MLRPFLAKFLVFVLIWLSVGCARGLALPLDETPFVTARLSPTTTGRPETSPTVHLLLPTTTRRPSSTPEPHATASPASPPEIRLLFTGIIVPGRCVQAGVEARGNADYLYENVRHLIQSADLSIGTLNGSLSDFSPKTGCVVTFVLVGSSIHAQALAMAGFDGVSAATNHIKNCNLSNCGDIAFLETMDHLTEAGVTPIGAGENLQQALQPVVFEVKGVRFGLISQGEIESMAFASENTPGIAVLNEENLREAIAAASKVSDVVIAMPHWGPEYSVNPNWNQRSYARIAVEAGADLVVGNHTHVVQAIQMMENVPVFYGLGNFVFDQTWSAETRQSVILTVTFIGKEYQGYELIPVVTDIDGMVHLAGEAESTQILGRIDQASQLLEP